MYTCCSPFWHFLLGHVHAAVQRTPAIKHEQTFWQVELWLQLHRTRTLGEEPTEEEPGSGLAPSVIQSSLLCIFYNQTTKIERSIINKPWFKNLHTTTYSTAQATQPYTKLLITYSPILIALLPSYWYKHKPWFKNLHTTNNPILTALYLTY